MAGLVFVSFGFSTGCGAVLGLGSTDASTIVFATGELQVTQASSLADLDDACRRAIETLAYDEIETVREAGERRWRATTPGGDPVDIHLKARGPEQTEVRIRVGVSGNEGRSRLVLEQIRQSL